ncbi:MAG: histidine kinase dimerization/phospho-acceptor domain-containing protein [Calditrichaceae bacterium]
MSRVYLNPINDNKSIFIHLTGVVSNRDAVGSKIYFYQSGDSLNRLIGFREVQTQCGYLSSCEPIIHFGTGSYQLIDIKIIFPSGNEITKKNLIPGKRYEFSEYSIFISKILFGLNIIRYNLSRVNFWLNFALIILLICILWTYIYLGFKRYHWQAFGMATQLIVWFVVSLIIYVIFRKTTLYTVLIALNSVSLFGMLIVSGYSERIRVLRLRRGAFRKKLQFLSEQMINYHSNDQLYEQLLNTLDQHDDIDSAKYIINDDGKLYLFDHNAQSKLLHKLTQSDTEKIIQQSVIADEADKTLLSILEGNKLNILLPVKRESALFGLIGFAELTRLFKELQEKEAQLIHSEKMASLGQVVAGISHELNNPISFIYANSKTLNESIEEIEQLWTKLDRDKKSDVGKEFKNILFELKSMVSDNLKGSQSVKDLVLNLKNFSRLDQAEWKDTNLVPGIESSLKLLKSQIPPDIVIEKKYETDPVLYCNPGQLNQVFLNLISNAAQAIPGAGKIYIRTFVKNKDLYVEIEDTGEGIDKKILK